MGRKGIALVVVLIFGVVGSLLALLVAHTARGVVVDEARLRQGAEARLPQRPPSASAWCSSTTWGRGGPPSTWR